MNNLNAFTEKIKLLRAPAILLVCSAHVIGLLDLSLDQASIDWGAHHWLIKHFLHGYFAIDLFIVISGYLMAKAFSSGGGENPIGMIAKRIAKIWFAIAATQVLWIVLLLFLQPREKIFEKNLIANLLLIGNLWDFKSNIAPWLWYLCMDAQLCVLGVFILVVLGKLKIKSGSVYLVILSFLVVGRVGLLSLEEPPLMISMNLRHQSETYFQFFSNYYLMPYMKLVEYWMGVSFFYLQDKSLFKKVFNAQWVIYFALLILFTIFWWIDFFPTSIQAKEKMSSIWFIGLSSLFVACAAIVLSTKFRVERTYQWIRWISEHSLEIYLVNFPLTILVIAVWRPTHVESLPSLLLYLGLTLGLTLSTAYWVSQGRKALKRK